MKLFTTTFCAVLLFAGTLFPQVFGELSIANQQAVGTDFFFDIYLTRTGTNDIYLGTADFVLTFNSGTFTNPAVTRDAAVNWNLFSTTGDPVGSLYRTATSPAPITGNEIIINLNQVAFGDQTDFDANIAKINNTPSTHKVGRYKVSGINNPSAFMNLQWKRGGSGVITKVFTLAQTSPWVSDSINITAINPPNAPLPVELTSFTAAYKNAAVMLNWVTKTEVNNYGFNVERKINEGEWNSIGFVEGHGNSNSPKSYSFTDKNPFGGSKFVYRLKQIDTDGAYEYSDEVEVELLPNSYELFQNYPNPFNPTTTIRFSLPQATQIKINLYNMLGEQIATLAEGLYETGYHKITFNASNLPSGAYVYRIESSDPSTGSGQSFVQVKKMILLR